MADEILSGGLTMDWSRSTKFLGLLQGQFLGEWKVSDALHACCKYGRERADYLHGV